MEDFRNSQAETIKLQEALRPPQTQTMTTVNGRYPDAEVIVTVRFFSVPLPLALPKLIIRAFPFFFLKKKPPSPN